MLTLPAMDPSREISEFFSLCGFYQAKITQVIRSCFIYEKFPLFLYSLVFFPDILRSDRVTAMHEKELSQKPNLCL